MKKETSKTQSSVLPSLVRIRKSFLLRVGRMTGHLRKSSALQKSMREKRISGTLNTDLTGPREVA